MVKVQITVIDTATGSDVTETATIAMRNEKTGNAIIKRTDGYYHCNPDTLYSVTVTVDGMHYYSRDVIYDAWQTVVDEIVEVDD